MNDDDLHRLLLAAFDTEHKEHLSAIRQALSAAAPDAGAPAASAVDVTDIFRRAHSLKGAARAVGLPTVEAIAHRLETVFAGLRDGALTLDRPTLRAVHLALDTIEVLVAHLPEEPEGTAAAAVFAALDALGSAGASGNGGTLGHDRTAGNGRAPGNIGGAMPPPALAAAPVWDAAPVAGADDRIRVAASSIDHLDGTIYDLAAETQRQSEIETTLQRLDAHIHGLATEWRKLRQEAAGLSAATPRGLPAALDAVDRQVSLLLRELPRALLTQSEAGRSLRRLGDTLREDVERLLMVPAEQVFTGFERMVRELARTAEKEVDVRTVGLAIAADRRVLQALKDPVMHMLRNAVAHGIETPAERRARGKPEAGMILLSLELQGSLLCLQVVDDGRGLDLAAIARAAVEQGRLSAADAAAASREALLKLLVQPGFSTAGGVDAVAGRGMGLAVLDEAMRQIQGAVQIGPTAGGGTTVTIRVPVTASRQSLLLVDCGTETFALGAHAAERLLRLPPDAIRSIEGRPTAFFDDRALPLAGLAALLGRDAELAPTSDGQLQGIVVAGLSGACILAVDRFREVRALRVEAADPETDRRLISGTVLLENGLPALVLDPEGLIERVLGRGPEPTAAPSIRAAQKPSGPTTILVVDDSLTTRTLERRILEAQGYRVLLSVDGVEALATLREEAVDLVVADVEMPRLDGFSLVEAIKKDPRLSSLPVILVTSRASSDDIRRGLDVGADAYIVKQKFDQRELLSTIGQLL